MKKNNFRGQNGGSNSFYSKFAFNGRDNNHFNSEDESKNENNSSMNSTKNNSFNQNNSSQNSNFTSSQFDDVVNKYGNMDEDNLMSTMLELAKNAKESGQLNNDGIEQFYNNSSNMLDAPQREKLRKLLDMLKD